MDEGFNPSARYEQVDSLARRILFYARDTLLVNLRFLDLALDLLQLKNYSGTLATDGRTLYYDPYYVVFTFRKSPAIMLRKVLHMLLHCVFRHLFPGPLQDRRRWDTACDVAVENVICGMDLPELAGSGGPGEREQLKKLEKRFGVLTADRLYRQLQGEEYPDLEISRMREPFQADDHRIWYLPRNPGVQKGRESGSGSGGGSQNRKGSEESEIERLWKAVSGKTADRLSERLRDPGLNAGGLLQNLSPLVREQIDYADFLRRFAVFGEILRVSREEFDNIFYTYGLSLYGNLPLIEPLEYSEVRRIRDFVVAVDTSGSVKGDTVKSFIRRTWEILSEQENFFRRVCIHIIQCDAEIQEDVRISSQEDLQHYLSDLTLRGFGGTDFRPVFSRVEELREKGEFSDLKGLLYFTDGMGVFPEHRPDYETAFVFLDNGNPAPEVPPWAIRLILPPDEIRKET